MTRETADDSTHPTKRARGWYTRGYLPHYDDPDKLQFITWRLADSLPAPVLTRLHAELEALNPERDDREIEYRKRIEVLLDRGYGECWLRRHQCAQAVVDALMEYEGQTHLFHSWVVMPNHVHVLVELTGSVPLGQLVEDWKAVSAKAINRHLNRTGPVWQEDFFDRFIRDQYHYDNTVRYITLNPVKGGLVKNPGHYRWSSAHR